MMRTYDATAAPHTLAPIVSALRAAGCVFAEDEAQLLVAEAPDSETLAEWVDCRISGMPLEHILGWAAFCGERIAVDPGVFVPRRRTELLVHQVVSLLRRDRPLSPHPVVVDLCCGSGAVGTALARLYPEVELHSADIDPAAVNCARRNVDAVGGRVYQGACSQHCRRNFKDGCGSSPSTRLMSPLRR